MKAKQRVPALRGGQPGDLASNRGSCDRISLQRASMRRKITLNNPGIWGMSDYGCPRPASWEPAFSRTCFVCIQPSQELRRMCNPASVGSAWFLYRPVHALRSAPCGSSSEGFHEV